MLSVIVKAFNEENNIARCIESILHETNGIDHEIIVVDSLSADQTVVISKRYPVKVVQFANSEDCGCGAAPQLGYQISKGDMIYLIDGDMEMIPGFISCAISYLQNNPSVAGVGGLLIDSNIKTIIEKRRSNHYQNIKNIIKVNSLGGGGLYRRGAIESVGYFSHKGLKAAEELELGLRLTIKKWHLVRLPIPSVTHFGHNETYVQSMARLWKNGRLQAYGALIRSSLGKKWFLKTIVLNWFVVLPVVLILTAFFVSFILSSLFSICIGFSGSILVVILLTVAILGIKKKSLKVSIISIGSWFILAYASMLGFFRALPSPIEPIQYVEI